MQSGPEAQQLAARRIMQARGRLVDCLFYLFFWEYMI